MTEKQIESFWDKVEIDKGCWVWTASKLASGYGRVTINDRWYLAHRVSAFLYKKLDYLGNKLVGARGQVVRHKCDNPSCVNPFHLETGTQKDNVQDCVIRNRRADMSGANNPNASVTIKKAKEIKKLLKENNLTHKQIAESLSVSKHVVSNISSGKTWSLI